MKLSTVLVLVVMAVVLGLVLTHPDWFPWSAGSLAMAIPVKDAATAARKFATRGAAAGADYANGVRGSGQRWQAGSAAGAQNYAQGVNEAIANNRFAKGIQEAGPAKFEERAATVGAQRFPQGIQGAEATWAQNTAPYLQTIASANLPPRGPKGDPRNQQRSAMMAELLRKRKVGG
jgi:hypothetical protein